MADNAYYPPVGFQFTVSVSGETSPIDSSFSEVSGLTSERDLATITEGGENRFVHQVPKQLKQQRLVLKRGIVVESSGLFIWCKKSLESDFFLGKLQTKDIDISLLNENGDPLLTWNVKNAWPIKWSLDAFNAQENKVAMETLEFAYTWVSRE